MEDLILLYTRLIDLGIRYDNERVDLVDMRENENSLSRVSKAKA